MSQLEVDLRNKLEHHNVEKGETRLTRKLDNFIEVFLEEELRDGHLLNSVNAVFQLFHNLIDFNDEHNLHLFLKREMFHFVYLPYDWVGDILIDAYSETVPFPLFVEERVHREFFGHAGDACSHLLEFSLEFLPLFVPLVDFYLLGEGDVLWGAALSSVFGGVVPGRDSGDGDSYVSGG